MKRGGELKRTPMKPGTKGLQRSAMKRGTVALKAKAPIQHRASPADTVEQKPKKRSRGLKGRAPTAAERAFMERAGQIACLACTKDGRHNPHISLHHTRGRTAPGAHFKVLPLCSPHHQPDDTDPLGRISVHGAKATFTAKYGTEAQLLSELYALLNFTPP